MRAASSFKALAIEQRYSANWTPWRPGRVSPGDSRAKLLTSPRRRRAGRSATPGGRAVSRRARGAARSLSLDDQLLLELKDYEALTARELAEIFDVPAGTIAGCVSRARERLRLAVKAMSGPPVLADETLHGLDSYSRAIRGTVQDLTKS